MSAYGFGSDYVLERQAVVEQMTIERVRELVETYLDPAKMVWLVVGDAATQRDRLTALGLGIRSRSTATVGVCPNWECWMSLIYHPCVGDEWGAGFA